MSINDLPPRPAQLPLSARRALNELRNLQEDPLDNISVGLTSSSYSDIHMWNAVLLGPAGTPYEFGIFHLSIIIPSNYPSWPHVPTIRFETPIWHPNVNEDGLVRLGAREKENWSPALTIRSLLLDVEVLMRCPDEDRMIAAAPITAEYLGQPEEFERTAMMLTRRDAMDGDDGDEVNEKSVPLST